MPQLQYVCVKLAGWSESKLTISGIVNSTKKSCGSVDATSFSENNNKYFTVIFQCVNIK